MMESSAGESYTTTDHLAAVDLYNIQGRSDGLIVSELSEIPEEVRQHYLDLGALMLKNSIGSVSRIQTARALSRVSQKLFTAEADLAAYHRRLEEPLADGIE